MKYFFIFIIIILIILFLSSSVLLDTPWFSDDLFKYENDKNIPIFVYLQNIQFITFLFLTSIVISYTHYSKKVYGNNIRKQIAFYIGLFFGSVIVINLLQSYYFMSYTKEILKESHYSQYSHLKGKLTISDAREAYNKYEVLIDYYDFNNTLQKFKPTKIDIKIKESNQWLQFKIDIIPLKIVLSFLIFIVGFSIANSIANKNITNNLLKPNSNQLTE